MGHRGRLWACALAMCAVCACQLAGAKAEERPEFTPKYLRGIDLQALTPPEPPELPAKETNDEAEIQFRAAFAFYRTKRWEYAARAFAEAVDYDGRRDDARYYLAASLILAGREADAVEQLDILLDGEYEMEARGLMAYALARLGRALEGREMAGPAATEHYIAAGWVARYDLLFREPERAAVPDAVPARDTDLSK